jgi:hypothetical protein
MKALAELGSGSANQRAIPSGLTTLALRGNDSKQMKNNSRGEASDRRAVANAVAAI